jgi:apolipoprotein D and lipocalin family protein
MLPFIILLFLIIIFIIIYFNITYEDNIKIFDIEKYQGKFYQVYKQNAFFENDCQLSTAYYQLTPDGKSLNVENICYSINGTGEEHSKIYKVYKRLRSIKGVAKPTKNPYIFDIEFEFGQKGIYRIIYTDYEFSIIGDLETNYLSILSRCPIINKEKLKYLKKIASNSGFIIN